MFLDIKFSVNEKEDCCRNRRVSADVVLIVGVIIVIAAAAVVDSVPDFAAAGIAGAVGIVAVGVINN
ncbi:MAG: hypothetical protein O6940_05020 [Ignavibacteria bacterium]|nr:hypothetical protein [Ignavibacteria bacterium]